MRNSTTYFHILPSLLKNYCLLNLIEIPMDFYEGKEFYPINRPQIFRFSCWDFWDGFFSCFFDGEGWKSIEIFPPLPSQIFSIIIIK
jgi:hypothetical protein